MNDYFNLDYVIWSTNKFDDDLFVDLVAKFSNLELAKDFVDYQATLGNGYAIFKDGKRVY